MIFYEYPLWYFIVSLLRPYFVCHNYVWILNVWGIFLIRFRELFVVPSSMSDKRRIALSERAKFANGSLSDHMVLLRVFQVHNYCCFVVYSNKSALNENRFTFVSWFWLFSGLELAGSPQAEPREAVLPPELRQFGYNGDHHGHSGSSARPAPGFWFHQS